MPELTAFRGLRYDTRAVTDISAVLCPPYDVISADERARLASVDPRNAVHVELPAASGAESPYEAAARMVEDWIVGGTLRRDDQPMIYVYEQRYALGDGVERSAMGFFCRLRLEPYGPDSGVLPHEHTMSGPKEDRFRLLTAVRANLSPVLFLYDDGDHGAASAALLDVVTEREPDVEGVGPGGLVNRLWVVDPESVGAARELLAIASARSIYIADGHHRYETALRYRDTASAADAPDADFVLSLMYDAHSGGLALLPWHRVLRGVDARGLLDGLEQWFSLERDVSLDRLLGQLDSSSEAGVIGAWTRDAGGAILRVERHRIEAVLPGAESETLRWLDVSVLSATLSAMVDVPLSELAAQGRLTYVSDARAAMASVDLGDADVAFLLRPTPTDAVLDVAAAGGYMPAKSTFFHPKAATGLVFNPLW
ncbi:MAG: DUF1015 domain-containing protein [Candidatus Limnocylindrales bacterium]